jgi:dTDP-4-amino-4,6-dideoxygalactose transaminase
MNQPIPFLDLRAQFDSIKDEVLPALMDVVESQRFIMGAAVGELEDAIARLCGTRHAIACASGTDALLLSLKTLDLQSGDEVITTPFTFFATAGAIHNAGGTPVFVDIEPDTFNIDPRGVTDAMTDRTRGIVAVHLYGQMAAMETLLDLAAPHEIPVIEDAAQAIGARRRIDDVWMQSGSVGPVATFSFFPSKNLGAWGDGGMIVTSEDERATRLRKLRTHGGAKQYHHDEIGTNSRLDTLQAAVLLRKLAHLDDWNTRRRQHAARYAELLDGIADVTPPVVDSANEHVFHQYTVRANRRDGLREALTEKGIGSAVYYPIALHRQPCFTSLGYARGSLPESERACEEVLSLPIYPELTDAQQERVADTIRKFYA